MKKIVRFMMVMSLGLLWTPKIKALQESDLPSIQEQQEMEEAAVTVFDAQQESSVMNWDKATKVYDGLELLTQVEELTDDTLTNYKKEATSYWLIPNRDEGDPTVARMDIVKDFDRASAQQKVKEGVLSQKSVEDRIAKIGHWGLSYIATYDAKDLPATIIQTQIDVPENEVTALSPGPGFDPIYLVRKEANQYQLLVARFPQGEASITTAHGEMTAGHLYPYAKGRAMLLDYIQQLTADSSLGMSSVAIRQQSNIGWWIGGVGTGLACVAVAISIFRNKKMSRII